MSASPRWADLLPELLCSIGDHLDLKAYAGARGACTAWRRALVPPSPALLVFADEGARSCRPCAASLPMRRSFELAAIVAGSRCVGCSNGWLALSVVVSRCQTLFVLLNPVTAVEILLPPLIYESLWVSKVSKVVFTPCPAKDDFAAAAICDTDRIAYVTAGATRWAVMAPVRLTTEDHLVDVVYTERGNKVYCLTECGYVHVLRLPERRRRKPVDVDVNEALGSSEPEFSLLQPSQPAENTINSRLLRWQHQRNSRMMQFGQARRRDQDPIIPTFYEQTSDASESQEAHLNALASLEPLLSPFNPASVFAPPYDIVSSFTSAKNLVICEGNLYQVWRNVSCTVTLQLPAGGQRRVAEHEILVLRYYPDKLPWQSHWDVVRNLGGHSLFVGRNNAVSMYAKDVPGLRGNCVYWIGGHGRDQGMVFDMESGRSTPVSVLRGHPHSRVVGWYFLSDAGVSSHRHDRSNKYNDESKGVNDTDCVCPHLPGISTFLLFVLVLVLFLF